MGKLGDILQGLKPTLLMIMTQVALTGVNIFLKLAVNQGMSLQVIIAYRYMFALATIVPFALVLERNNRPRLTWKITIQAFFCALLGGCMSQNFYAESLALTSATYAAAFTNLMPAVTFIMAVLCRMEVLGLKTMAGKAKVVGTLVCIGGAMILTFYKGTEINLWSTHIDILHENQGGHVSATYQHGSVHSFMGPLLAFLSCISAAFSLIVQATMSKAYPCYLSSTALISAMGSVQALVYALCTERNWDQWKLGWNLRLLVVLYLGVLGAGVVWAIIMSVVRMRGPLFVSVFNPLLLILVALSGSLFLDEQLYMGSVLGAVIIIVGLYSVLWGKSKEMMKISQLVPTAEPGEAGPGSTRESSFRRGSFNVMAVAPNFVPATDLLEFVDDDDGEDLEAKGPKNSVSKK